MKFYYYRDLIDLNENNRDMLHDIMLEAAKDTEIKPDPYKELLQYSIQKGYTWK